jgi:hypothetical protein
LSRDPYATHGLKPHSAAARKAVRRQEAEERAEKYERAILREMGLIYLEKDGPEDEIRAEAKAFIDEFGAELYARGVKPYSPNALSLWQTKHMAQNQERARAQKGDE